MIAQMISPHTTAPTAHAATQDPCQRVSATWPCLVTGTGNPIRVKALDVHPAVAGTTVARTAASGSARRHRGAGPRRGGPAAVWPGARPGTRAPRPRGALGVGLTGCLPSG